MLREMKNHSKYVYISKLDDKKGKYRESNLSKSWEINPTPSKKPSKSFRQHTRGIL